jgi:hypothetical protein
LPAQLYFFFSAPFLTAAIAILLIGPARASIQSNPGSLFRCRLRGLLRPTNGGS